MKLKLCVFLLLVEAWSFGQTQSLDLAPVATAQPWSRTRVPIMHGGFQVLSANANKGSVLDLWVKCNYRPQVGHCLAGNPIDEDGHAFRLVKETDGQDSQTAHYRLDVPENHTGFEIIRCVTEWIGTDINYVFVMNGTRPAH